MATEDEFPVGATGGGRPTAGADHESCLLDPDAFVVELVDFVAEATDAAPTELPPLADAVDPEAVQRLLAADDGGRTVVRFEYAGCEVVVTDDGGMFLHQ